MKNTDLVHLLRELADCADALAYERVRTMNGDLRLLSTRARQAAGEIEQDDHTITVAISDESMAGLKAMCEDVVARQVAEEIEARKVASDEELNRCFDDALRKEFEAVWAGPQHDDHYSLSNQRIRQRRIQGAGLRAVLARFGGGEIERRDVASCAAMTCSLLAQYQSEVDVIESVAGFTDESTPVGEAWARICGVLDRVGGGEAGSG